MTKRNMRVSAALLTVFVSLLMASLACYSGQVPGLFELTPFQTPTPIPVVENPRFKLLDIVLAPHEPGLSFFNMTLFPEPLEPSLLNSKSLCESDSPAQILFAGLGEGDAVYYLVDCTGSVGWVAENRLAGPLKFKNDDLALTISETGQPIQLLDEHTLTPLVTFAVCMPETVVTIAGIRAADVENDGIKEVYYYVECPAGTRGWASNKDLFGPIEVRAKDRALAVSVEQAEFRLSSEAAPVTENNAVEGDCPAGSVLEVQSAKLVGEDVYYNVLCGELEGWVNQHNLIGPLRFDADSNAIIYVEPLLVFEDELPTEGAGAIEAVAEGEQAEASSTPESAAETDEAVPAEDAEGAEQRKVVLYTPPVYLTDLPGPAVRTGEDANVVGQCLSNAGAHVLEYAGMNEIIYYRVTCDECVESETTPDGETTCSAYETREGWVEQQYLQGPVSFLPGEKAVFKSSSAALEVDKETGIQYARIPVSKVGAETYGESAAFAGRCPADAEVVVTGVMLEKARTSNKFTFFYEVQCEGQTASVTLETDHAGKTRPVTHYDADEVATITGVVLARDLESPPQ